MCGISMGAIVMCVALGTLHTLGMIDGREGSSLYEGPLEYLHAVADAQARVWMLLLGVYNTTDIVEYRFSQSNPLGITLPVAGVSLVLKLIGGIAWCGGIMVNMLWGLMFWLLLHTFLQLVRANPTRDTLDVSIYYLMFQLMRKALDCAGRMGFEMYFCTL